MMEMVNPYTVKTINLMKVNSAIPFPPFSKNCCHVGMLISKPVWKILYIIITLVLTKYIMLMIVNVIINIPYLAYKSKIKTLVHFENKPFSLMDENSFFPLSSPFRGELSLVSKF